MLLLVAFGLGGCRPEGVYTRAMDAGPTGSGGSIGATGGASATGTGGTNVTGTGGASATGTGGAVVVGGSGGRAGTGGTPGGTGGLGSGGSATGGNASGGAGVGSGGSGGSGVGTGGTAGQGIGGGATGGAGVGGGGTAGSGTGGAGGAGPLVMSIDFVGGITSAGGAGGAVLIAAPAMSPAEVAGFKPASNWNSAPMNTGLLSNLVLSDGTVTAATLTFSSPSMGANPGVWRNNYPDAPGDARMMNGYLDPAAAATPATIAVGALPASFTAGGYDVYVYMVGDIPSATTRTYGYAIGATTFTVSQTGPAPTTFGGFTVAPAGGAGNYVVFRNLTGTSFTLIATPGTGAPTRAPVNGLQIVAPTGS